MPILTILTAPQNKKIHYSNQNAKNEINTDQEKVKTFVRMLNVLLV